MEEKKLKNLVLTSILAGGMLFGLALYLQKSYKNLRLTQWLLLQQEQI